MRSTLSFCVVVSASAALLAGCSGEGESQRPTITTTVIVTSTRGVSEGRDALQPTSEKSDGASSIDPSVGYAPVAGDEPESAPATAPGEIMVTGTVEVRTAQELMGGRELPYGSPTDEYVVLVLNQPVTVSGMKAGDAVTETVSELSLGPASTNPYASLTPGPSYDDLDGQSVTVVFKAQNVSFPSDTSLPLGMPIIRNAITSIR